MLMINSVPLLLLLLCWCQSEAQQRCQLLPRQTSALQRFRGLNSTLRIQRLFPWLAFISTSDALSNINASATLIHVDDNFYILTAAAAVRDNAELAESNRIFLGASSLCDPIPPDRRVNIQSAIIQQSIPAFSLNDMALVRLKEEDDLKKRIIYSGDIQGAFIPDGPQVLKPGFQFNMMAVEYACLAVTKCWRFEVVHQSECQALFQTFSCRAHICARFKGKNPDDIYIYPGMSIVFGDDKAAFLYGIIVASSRWHYLINNVVEHRKWIASAASMLASVPGGSLRKMTGYQAGEGRLARATLQCLLPQRVRNGGLRFRDFNSTQRIQRSFPWLVFISDSGSLTDINAVGTLIYANDKYYVITAANAVHKW
ncbi:unnamed protein product [Soboliphyme baturini]|uniref:Peptidase S1 domain-containing protein n=1 Tax=Soboliphyme baturini TaxID=241478 RepID=A0A183J5E4_9BILA|nr:unnamed protein product [Soboliphyme baturini]